MARHKWFIDGAGYTRHCWECVHAKKWECMFGEHFAKCEVTGHLVAKHDSPNNPCCHLECGSYDDGSGDG